MLACTEKVTLVRHIAGRDSDSYDCTVLDGSSIRQFQFAVSSRRYHDQNIAQSLDNLKFFEELTAWAETAPLPAMDAGKTARRIVVTSSAYPFTVSDNGTARYQTQMRLEYYQEGER